MLVLLGLVSAQRPATVHEVQPSSRDRVHAIWLNGPTFSGKVSGGGWPAFEADVDTRSGTMCAALDDARYSGYDEGGQYCEAASPALDDDAHLLLHSGRLGVVVDVGPHARNVLPRLGATSGTAATARAVYDALNTSSTNITLDVACGSANTSYVLGTTGGGPTLTLTPSPSPSPSPCPSPNPSHNSSASLSHDPLTLTLGLTLAPARRLRSDRARKAGPHRDAG